MLNSLADSLGSNDRLLDQWLAKDDALVCPLKALFGYCPTPPYNSTAHYPPLVVEITHNDMEPFVLFTEQVADRYMDVFELNVCGGCSR